MDRPDDTGGGTHHDAHLENDCDKPITWEEIAAAAHILIARWDRRRRVLGPFVQFDPRNH